MLISLISEALLTKKEFLVLLVLARKEESVVSKGELYRQVWGDLISNAVCALYTTVSRLKKRLNAAGAGTTISISQMAGYSLKMSEK